MERIPTETYSLLLYLSLDLVCYCVLPSLGLTLLSLLCPLILCPHQQLTGYLKRGPSTPVNNQLGYMDLELTSVEEVYLETTLY